MKITLLLFLEFTEQLGCIDLCLSLNLAVFTHFFQIFLLPLFLFLLFETSVMCMLYSWMYAGVLFSSASVFCHRQNGVFNCLVLFLRNATCLDLESHAKKAGCFLQGPPTQPRKMGGANTTKHHSSFLLFLSCLFLNFTFTWLLWTLTVFQISEKVCRPFCSAFWCFCGAIYSSIFADITVFNHILGCCTSLVYGVV